jgi:large subunit ribosomal protein L30
MAKLKVTLQHSPIGHRQRAKDTVRALGLRKIGQTVVHEDVPSIRGMVHVVRHLVAVEESTEA